MPAIEVRDLTKRFGPVVAVDQLSFAVEDCTVTGFLGLNGAGKTTTLRTLLGLVRPTTGEALIDGNTYRQLADPFRAVGAALEASAFYPGRSAIEHLRVLATAAGISFARCDELLEVVGLTEVAGRKVGRFSMGMRQRLHLAGALLGDPRVLILDEPANGLDPAGIAWLRALLRHLADNQGKTILVSSHVLAEVAQTVDDVVIISRGRLIAHAGLDELEQQATRSVLVRSPAVAKLGDALDRAGIAAKLDLPDRLRVANTTTDTVGQLAFEAGVPLHELTAEATNLERLFLELTGDGDGSATDAAVPTVHETSS